MRKNFNPITLSHILLWLFLLSILFDCNAQAPQGMNYQGMVRDSQGNIIPNRAIGIKFNIRQGNVSGPVVYSETHATTSDQFGGLSLVIGEGAPVIGTFAAINWASGSYFNEVLLDVTGGTNYISMGTSQLMSVPYALYAKESGTSNAFTTNYTIKFNGTYITDSTHNYVYAGEGKGMFITKHNYFFFLAMPDNADGIIDSTVKRKSFIYTGDTLNLTSVYVPVREHPRGQIFDIPEGFYYGFPHALGTYYVPINATPVSMTNIFGWQGCTINQIPCWGAPNVTDMYYQAFANNPAITGFSLPLPVTITIQR